MIEYPFTMCRLDFLTSLENRWRGPFGKFLGHLWACRRLLEGFQKHTAEPRRIPGNMTELSVSAGPQGPQTL